MVSEALRDLAWRTASEVVDPEIPVLTLADLGVVRDVTVADGRVEVAITPTYSGCPATAVIAADIRQALQAQGIDNAKVRTVLAPAWTTDWMSEDGRRKLAAYGIAPPAKGAGRGALFGIEPATCPHCGSADTAQISRFGSTPCKALWRCNACREPFDQFKCH